MRYRECMICRTDITGDTPEAMATRFVMYMRDPDTNHHSMGEWRDWKVAPTGRRYTAPGLGFTVALLGRIVDDRQLVRGVIVGIPDVFAVRYIFLGGEVRRVRQVQKVITTTEWE